MRLKLRSSTARKRLSGYFHTAFLALTVSPCSNSQPVQVQLPQGRNSPISINRSGDSLAVDWPTPTGWGHITFDLIGGRPLIRSLSASGSRPAPKAKLGSLAGLDVAYYLTVGTRVGTPGRPPEMTIWNEFFDNPASRSHRTYRSHLDFRNVRTDSSRTRARVSFGGLTAGPFAGILEFTFFTGSPLIQVEAVVSTNEDRSALFYDAGLIGTSLSNSRMIWVDTTGKFQNDLIEATTPPRNLAVRHRTLVAESVDASVGILPPPHQFFFPRDYTDNLSHVWMGRNYHGFEDPLGIGIRQAPTGGGAFVPWFNAPPGTQQRLTLFLHVSPKVGEAALKDVLQYTHDDRFAELPGQITFTSHYHMALAVETLQPAASPTFQPSVVEANSRARETAQVFRNMGVNVVHLAEFHGDGHQNDPGPLRLPEMRSMFHLCRSLSDQHILFLPGEEISGILGIKEPGKHPGHWMTLFPKPVYFTQVRQTGQPFIEQDISYGPIYHVGGKEDIMELLQREHGLGWTAHPRIKASSWTPDVFRREPYYLADYWLGAAWKAMPADLSRERLGERALDLLSDMANWGQKKYLPGEVDVFKIDHTHELYGHMNINYLRMQRGREGERERGSGPRLVPRFEDGWQPVLDALRSGAFFTTTGEVLIRDFTVGGKRSGETLQLGAESSVVGGRSSTSPEIRVELEWTFPMKFAEVISGDGKGVFRERIDLSDTPEFGRRTLILRPNLRGRKWVRFEAWDIACNGAYTQPVWLKGE